MQNIDQLNDDDTNNGNGWFVSAALTAPEIEPAPAAELRDEADEECVHGTLGAARETLAWALHVIAYDAARAVAKGGN